MSFLTLGKSTTLLGVAMIASKPRSSRGSGPFWWALHRLVFVLIRGTIGIILLSDLTFTTTYPIVFQSRILNAGLSPLNASVLTPFDADAVSEFWWNFPSLMTDQAITKTITPLTCTNCTSYFFPGAMMTVEFDPGLPDIGRQNFSQAGVFIVNDAPGYQIDFAQVGPDYPPFVEDDCKVYGMNW